MRNVFQWESMVDIELLNSVRGDSEYVESGETCLDYQSLHKLLVPSIPQSILFTLMISLWLCLVFTLILFSWIAKVRWIRYATFTIRMYTPQWIDRMYPLDYGPTHNRATHPEYSTEKGGRSKISSCNYGAAGNLFYLSLSTNPSKALHHWIRIMAFLREEY